MKKNKKKYLHIFLILSFSLLFGGETGTKASLNHMITVTEGLRSPLRLCIVSGDRVVSTDYVKKCICCYDSGAVLKTKIMLRFSPLCLAADKENKIYVGGAKNGRITVFTMDGTIVNSFGKFAQPNDAVFDDEQNLYIVDSKKAEISVFNRDGVFQRSFGRNILNFPTAVAFDIKNGRVLVAEHGGIVPPDSSAAAATIHIFDKNGNWLGHYGSYGSGEGEFTRIQGLTVDEFGRIYAVDSFQGNITVLDERGNFIERIGEYGSSRGELRLPVDLVIDSRNRLWVSSLNNQCIDIFKLSGFPTVVADKDMALLPLKDQLLPNYPNPFNPGTHIPFIITKNEDITVNIYNLAGQKVRSIHIGLINRGRYTSQGKAVYWDGKNDGGKTVASGFYFYELHSKSFTKVRRMLLLK